MIKLTIKQNQHTNGQRILFLQLLNISTLSYLPEWCIGHRSWARTWTHVRTSPRGSTTAGSVDGWVWTAAGGCGLCGTVRQPGCQTWETENSNVSGYHWFHHLLTPKIKYNEFLPLRTWIIQKKQGNTMPAGSRFDSRFAPSQWETLLQSNTISHWLGANLESALWVPKSLCCRYNTNYIDGVVQDCILSSASRQYLHVFDMVIPQYCTKLSQCTHSYLTWRSILTTSALPDGWRKIV